MNRSFRISGQTSADSNVQPAAASTSPSGPDDRISVRRCLATHPDRPVPLFSVRFIRRAASAPAAYRQVTVSFDGVYRNSEQVVHGTMFATFDEMSAIVSTTPRL